MNAAEMVRELKKPGEVWLWVSELDDYLPVVKVCLRKSLASLLDDEGHDLDARAYWNEDGSVFVIDDFGATAEAVS